MEISKDEKIMLNNYIFTTINTIRLEKNSEGDYKYNKEQIKELSNICVKVFIMSLNINTKKFCEYMNYSSEAIRKLCINIL